MNVKPGTLLVLCLEPSKSLICINCYHHVAIIADVVIVSPGVKLPAFDSHSAAYRPCGLVYKTWCTKTCPIGLWQVLTWVNRCNGKHIEQYLKHGGVPVVFSHCYCYYWGPLYSFPGTPIDWKMQSVQSGKECLISCLSHHFIRTDQRHFWLEIGISEWQGLGVRGGTRECYQTNSSQSRPFCHFC